MIPDKQHIAPLDGIRGIAVLLVFMNHCAPNGWNKTWFAFGWSGVDLFFVLSGFLITRILINSRPSEHYFRNFFARRFLRLFPLYYAVLFAVIYFGHQIPYYESLWNTQIYYWTYTQNILMAFKGVPEFRAFHHFWSLGVEEQFYLVWPYMIYKFSEKNLKTTILAGIVLSILLRNINPHTPFAYMMTLCRTEGLLLGGLAALLYSNNKLPANRVIGISLVINLLIILGLWALTGTINLNAEPWVRFGYTLIDLFYFLFLLLVLGEGKAEAFFNRLLTTKFLVFLGKYSYGIYVYHAILYVLVFNANTKDPVHFVYLSIMTIGISVISYHVLEMPFLRLKRFFPNSK
jgi:peptidoglycan/LPS O-acetylase OafA/YrhL